MATTTVPAKAEPRVIGRRRAAAKRETFELAVYRGETEELWPFTVRAQMDTASVFDLSSEDSSPARRLGGLRNFMMRAFVDDDGVPLDEQPAPFVEADDDDEGIDEPKPEPGALVPVSEVDSTRGRDVQWRVGDPKSPQGHMTFPSESLARKYANENGSSLRRLVYAMDSPYLIVEQTALEEIVDVIVSAAADRPTEASGASSRSRPRRAQ
jgi:hypothetical protein